MEKILTSINAASNILQRTNMDIEQAAFCLDTSYNEVRSFRSKLQNIVKEATIIACKWGVASQFSNKRCRTVKKHFDELAQDHRFENAENFFKVNTFYRVVDIVSVQLRKRFAGLQTVADLFSFLTPAKLLKTDDDTMIKYAKNVQQKFSSDISESLSVQLVLCVRSLKNEIQKLKTMSRFNYNEEDMKKAIDAVKKGSPIATAAKTFEVPRMTLSDKCKGKTPIQRKMGPPSILSETEEQHLVRWICHLGSKGFPVTSCQLLDSVQMLLKSQNKTNPFANNRPGQHWLEAFQRRHPELATRVSQNLTKSRASVSETNIRIRKGQKMVHSVTNSDEKENITTLVMGNAEGDLAPPMVVVNLKRVPKSLADSMPQHWAIGRSDNGWMTGQTFFEYITNVFYPWLVEKSIPIPVILYLDGHASHLTLPSSEFCKDKGIEIVALYPNSTHFLQPMDVAVFHPLNVAWKKEVYKWRIENAGVCLKRDNFSLLLHKVLKNTLKPEMFKNGFRACGLVPLNPDALDYFKSHIPQEKLQLFKESGPTWLHKVEYTELFLLLWFKINETINKEVTEIELEPQENVISSLDNEQFAHMLINIFPENEPIEFVVGEEGTLQQITTEELYPYYIHLKAPESHKEGVIIPSGDLETFTDPEISTDPLANSTNQHKNTLKPEMFKNGFRACGLVPLNPDALDYFKHWAIGRSDNGWMTGQTFFEYITNVFYPWLVEKSIPIPVILYLDGHASHLTLPSSEFCKDKGIEIVALYPNSTHFLQPMDVAVFHPLNVAWKKEVYKWRIENAGVCLKRDNFSLLLHKVLKNTLKPEMFKNGFRACGLVPLNPDALDYFKSHIPQEKLQLFKESGPTWLHKVKYTELFLLLWFKINETINKEVTEIELEPQENVISSLDNEQFAHMLINIFPENEPIEFVVGEEGTLQQITTEELYPYYIHLKAPESHKEGVIIPSGDLETFTDPEISTDPSANSTNQHKQTTTELDLSTVTQNVEKTIRLVPFVKINNVSLQPFLDTLLDISITRTEESSIPSTEIESHDLAVAVDKSTSIQITEKNILVDPPATATESEAEMNQTVHSDKVVAVDEYSSIQGQTSELNIPVNLYLPAPEQVVNQDTPINMTLEESLQNNKEKDILADIPFQFLPLERSKNLYTYICSFPRFSWKRRDLEKTCKVIVSTFQQKIFTNNKLTPLSDFSKKKLDQILLGKAYSRGIMAHSLVNAVLARILFIEMEKKNLSETEQREFANDWATIVRLTKNVRNIKDEKSFNNKSFLRMYNKFINHMEEVCQRGPIAKLWIQYFKMSSLIKQFLEAEKSGNWQLHLDCTQKMLPYFHAAGHYKYAQCGHLYLQEMLSLREIMDPVEYNKFTEGGLFTIRRSQKFYSGIFSDQTIEQMLMRQIKISGGLTQRGMTESIMGKWVGCRIAFVDITTALSEFTGVEFHSSEQHKDARVSKINEAAAASYEIFKFFEINYPFPAVPEIISIASGIENIHSIIGKKWKDFKKTKKVFTLADMNAKLKVNDVNVDIEEIFSRVQKSNLLSTNPAEFKIILKSECCPVPPCLFNAVSFRKSEKSALYKLYTLISQLPTFKEICFVIDGGYLLRRVTWTSDDTFSTIRDKYIEFLKSFKPCLVVFDGYPSTPTIKSYERTRRATNHFSNDITFINPNSRPTKQADFLSNGNNKNLLIEFIMNKINISNADSSSSPNMAAIQVFEDADLDIVKKAMEKATDEKACIIIGNDIDLLILLTQLSATDCNVFISKYSPTAQTYAYYSPRNCKYYDFRSVMLFLHAFCGCDTTSSFYMYGKTKIFDLFEKNPDLLEAAKIFNKENADKSELYQVAKTIVFKLYGKKSDFSSSLADYRCEYYDTLTNRDIKLLPLTDGALRMHVLRVYLQCQTWLGRSLDATQYGWKIKNDILVPIYSDEVLIPEKILKKIHCACKTNCMKCSCRKRLMFCNKFCTTCKGNNCTNVEVNGTLSDDRNSSESENFIENVQVWPDIDVIEENLNDDSDGYIGSSDDEFRVAKKAKA
ncbi:hypothetical protein FQR65_LT14444 [Abscondita terminalis]|nr:hypothetical protein FQR65_LT14444 [Abscondita terminalis]